MEPVVIIDNLRKRYGQITAVDGISFSVESGQVFCLVGPNGAGKTTTIECLLGLRTADSGDIRILGLSPTKERTRLFKHVGVQFQENSLYPAIKVHEALGLFASMYEAPLAQDMLLEAFDLKKRAKVAYRGLSGGQRRMLLIAIALIGNPRLLILDEPTSGLDPHARLALWTTLNEFRRRGLTILMSTHNMQEAEEQSDVVCMVDHGRIIASGPPSELLNSHSLGMRIAVATNGHTPDPEIFSDCPGMTRTERREHEMCFYGVGQGFIDSATERLRSHGFQSYTMRPAALEDLYLMITGINYEAVSV